MVCEDTTLTYAELDAAASRLARLLARHGVQPEHVVAVAMDRSPSLPISLLAVSKAGAAFLPVDQEYPVERVGFMLADAKPACVLTTSEIAGMLTVPDGIPVLVVDAQETEAQLTGGRANGVVPLRPENPAYVIYTSGSAGAPKGVVVTHTGLASLAAAQIENVAARQGSRVLQFSSPGFDASASELMMALCSGATLVLAGTGRALAGRGLTEMTVRHGVTHLTVPPAVLTVTAPDALSSVTSLVSAGEALPPEMVRRWAPGRRFVNAYGPTEATVCVTMSGPLDPDEEPHIGTPISNTEVFLLDSFMEPVPPGVTGEVYVAGAGVARGYLGQVRLTAERFVASPFGTGQRMYRTGDIARRRADGCLTLHGRADDQLKIRGFRVEPGEVVAALNAHPAVAQAFVMTRESTAGDPRLVAYLVPADADVSQGGDLRHTIRTHLAKRLPEYMIPTALVMLEALPMTAHGKIDKAALPAPGYPHDYHRAGTEPTTESEAVLCAAFAEVLGVDRVGVEDNFFALGGHSLLTVSLAERLNARGLRITARTIMEAPTVSSLLRRLSI